MCEGGMQCKIFFSYLGNRNEEDSRFLHNLLINIEIISIILSQNSLQPILVIQANLFPIAVTIKLDKGPTTNQEHIISIITILGTNHFCLERYINLSFWTSLDHSEQSMIYKFKSVQAIGMGPNQKLVVYLTTFVSNFVMLEKKAGYKKKKHFTDVGPFGDQTPSYYSSLLLSARPNYTDSKN